MNKAIGLLEVLGYSVALKAIDKACKAANIQIEGIECNNPTQGDNAQIPVVIQVKFTGAIDDVKFALKISSIEAQKYISPENISTHLIPSSVNEMQKLLSTGKVQVKS